MKLVQNKLISWLVCRVFMSIQIDIRVQLHSAVKIYVHNKVCMAQTSYDLSLECIFINLMQCVNTCSRANVKMGIEGPIKTPIVLFGFFPAPAEIVMAIQTENQPYCKA